MNHRLINRIIFVLSLLGIAMAIYVLQSFMRQSPIVCISTGCEVVRKSSHSYPFGVPVPLFGLVGYSILATCAFLRTLKLSAFHLQLATRVMLGVSIFGVCFVSWFTYTELFVIKAVCTWCAISAINMYVIFALVLKSYLRKK